MATGAPPFGSSQELGTFSQPAHEGRSVRFRRGGGQADRRLRPRARRVLRTLRPFFVAMRERKP